MVKAHETGEQWNEFHCRWIETHRDGPTWRKIAYFLWGFIQFLFLIPFYDIVHMHVSFQGSLKRKCIFIRIAKFAKKRTIVHFHPPTPDVLNQPENKKYYKYLFESADKVLVLSHQWVLWIKELIYDDHSPDNLTVLYNPCPIVGEENILPIENHDKYILFAGTLIVRKGYKCLIRSFARLANEFPEWKVVFAGVDEEQQAEELVKALQVEKQIVLRGWCDKQKMRDLFKRAGIYCLPSSGEGFPMVVLEAWAYGVPVVCTPVGGLPDVLVEGENAMTFSFDNDDELTSQLKLLMSNQDLMRKLSNEGLKLAQKVFDVHTINKKLGDIYRNL